MREGPPATILACFLLPFLSAAGLQDAVENPAYRRWADSAPGSWVTLTLEGDTAGYKSRAEMTTTLKEINEKEAVIEQKTVAILMGERTEQPPHKDSIPAKVAKEPPDPAAPKPEEGEEEIEVAGKKLKCRWVRLVTEKGGVKVTTRSWYASEIPGGLARMETTTEGAAAPSIVKMAATAWEKKKS